MNRVGCVFPEDEIRTAHRHAASAVARTPCRGLGIDRRGALTAAGGGKRDIGNHVKEIMEKAGDINDARFTTRFRAELRRRLREERGAGKVAADVVAAIALDKQVVADRIRAAAGDLPESCVRAGNVIPLQSGGSDLRGSYRKATADRPALIVSGLS